MALYHGAMAAEATAAYGSIVGAASRVVDLVEPPRQEEYRLPETKREALEELNGLLIRDHWLRTIIGADSTLKDMWSAHEGMAHRLLDFIFEGHEDEDPRSQEPSCDLRLIQEKEKALLEQARREVPGLRVQVAEGCAALRRIAES